MRLFIILFTLFKSLSTKRKLQLIFLFFLMVIGAFSEMATLGAAVPFLVLIAEPSGYNEKYPILSNIIDFLGFETSNFLLMSSILFCSIVLFAGFFRIFLMWYSFRLSMNLGVDIGKKVYRNTLYKSYEWHVKKNSSEIIANLDKVNSVVNGVIVPVFQGITALVLGFGVLAMLIFLDPKSALIAGLSFLILYAITSFVLKRPLQAAGREVSLNLNERIKSVQEGVGGIRDIILDSTQEVYVNRYSKYDFIVRKGLAKINIIASSPRYIIESVGMIIIVILAFWLADGSSTKMVQTIPVLGVLAIGAQKLLPQMQIAYSSLSNILGNKNQLNDILKYLVFPEQTNCNVVNNNGNLNIKYDISNNQVPFINMQNVNYQYSVDGPIVLKNINLKIYRGMVVGFVGKTGSGKSTLVDLLMGLLKPTSGSIKINGVPINSDNMYFWQKKIAHVPQSIYLSDTNLEENIAFGQPPNQIDNKRVKDAASKAQLELFIESLPDKYFTNVGERGVKLSGGQRQRIGLARAFYKNADLLILDEATSALDSDTEYSVIENILKDYNNPTIIMIAHRVSTLKKCDIIYEITDGCISRSGTFQQLFV